LSAAAEHHAPPLAGLHGHAPCAPEWFTGALAQAAERTELRVQGAPIEVLAWGRVGDPGLLLLHGNGAHADWYSFIAPLLLPGRRVVAMSFSGMGRSGWRTQYSRAQWADEALAVAHATGLLQGAVPPVVAGHSFGGLVLMDMAARHGQHLGRALVVDAPARPPSRDDHAPRSDVVRSARVYATPAQALERFRLIPPQACPHPFIAHHIASHGLKVVVGPEGREGWVWRMDPYRFRHFQMGRPSHDLRQARCPLVLVRGGQSRLLSAEGLARMAHRAPPGTTTDEVPGADHHVMVDQPLAFAELLRRHCPPAC
jgi:pimeloyl-ACP methyl ester carboxylesterase